MKQYKTITLIFYIFFIAGFAIMLFFSLKMKAILNVPSLTDEHISAYSVLQKQISYAGIMIFISQLLISFILYYRTTNKNPIFLTNILYIGFMLFVYFSSNYNYYKLLNKESTSNTSYWLFIFIGLFYILGAILVSAIGYITIKNITNRNSEGIHKNRRNKNSISN